MGCKNQNGTARVRADLSCRLPCYPPSILAFPAVETTQLVLEWWLVINHCEGSVGDSDLDASIKTLLALANSTVCISW